MGRPRKITPVETDAELAPVENYEQSSIEYDEKMVATLKKYPHIHCVYFDEEGNWYFIEKPELLAISREDILNG